MNKEGGDQKVKHGLTVSEVIDDCLSNLVHVSAYGLVLITHVR